MRKLYLITILFLLTLAPSWGQAQSRDVLEIIADSCCAYIHTADTTLSKEAYTTQMGLYFLKYATPYKKELKSKYNLNLDAPTDETWEKLGELIVLKRVTICPDLIPLLTDKSSSSSSASGSNQGTDDASNAYLVGTLVEVQKSQFATVVIKDVNGRNQKLLWMGYFDRSDLLKNPDKLRSTEMKFYYKETELYNPQIEDYMTYKVLTKLQAE